VDVAARKPEYRYWLRVIDRSTREQRTFDEGVWRYDDSSFPHGLYQQVLDYAKEHL